MTSVDAKMKEAVEMVSAPSVTQNEIAFLISLIEQVSKRGAFQASEMKDVGIVYEKLRAIYNHNITPDDDLGV